MLYPLIKRIVKLFICLKFRIDVIGLEHVPRQDALIVAANHISNYDPVLLSCILKRKIHFIAKAELFRNWFFKTIFLALLAIPVNRQSGIVIRPVRKILKLIERGEVFGIFPEGKRCLAGELVQPKKGVAYFACKTDVRFFLLRLLGLIKGIEHQ
jgi:1-acyl-sn-glycerol-3-phosphate acyltransferase